MVQLICNNALVMKNKNSLIVWNHPGLAWTESCSLGYDLRSSLQKKNNDPEWMGNASESDNKGILRYYRHSRVSLSEVESYLGTNHCTDGQDGLHAHKQHTVVLRSQGRKLPTTGQNLSNKYSNIVHIYTTEQNCL